jgi:hypothetical protein
MFPAKMFTMAVLSLACSAMAVTGLVVDHLKSPLAGVSVQLMSAGSTITTGLDGHFLLLNPSTGAEPIGLVPAQVGIVHGNLEFSLPQVTLGAFVTLTIQGKQIHSMPAQQLSAGVHQFQPFGRLQVARGIYLVKYQLGSQTGVLTLAVTAADLGPMAQRKSNVSALRLTSATIDSVVFTKTGYVRKAVPIATYSDDLDSVTLNLDATSSSNLSSSSAPISSSAVSSSSTGLNPSLPPGGNFDLSFWNLQEPIGAVTATNILAADLKGANGFTDPYFYTATDGAMTFYVPVKGSVTTSGSKYPRSELREMQPGGIAKAVWDIAAGTHTLSATLKVVHMADHAAIGQIHTGATLPGKTLSTTIPICELFYGENGDLRLGLESAYDGSMGGYSSMPIITNVPLGQVFSYTIMVNSTGTLTITITTQDSAPASIVRTIHSSFFEMGHYFKAGNYLQIAPSTAAYSNESSTVSFYSLRVSHQ